jgi:hypothetical protein
MLDGVNAYADSQPEVRKEIDERHRNALKFAERKAERRKNARAANAALSSVAASTHSSPPGQAAAAANPYGYGEGGR